MKCSKHIMPVRDGFTMSTKHWKWFSIGTFLCIFRFSESQCLCRTVQRVDIEQVGTVVQIHPPVRKGQQVNWKQLQLGRTHSQPHRSVSGDLHWTTDWHEFNARKTGRPQMRDMKTQARSNQSYARNIYYNDGIVCISHCRTVCND